VYLARHTSQRVNKISSPPHLSNREWKMHNELIERAVERLGNYVERPSDSKREALRELLRELESVNHEYEPIPYGTARKIRNRYALIAEEAVQCVLPAGADSVCVIEGSFVGGADDAAVRYGESTARNR
jgi:hypothetical protein